MPEGNDWRQGAQYDYIAGLDAADLAWEFLRRNADYKRDYHRIPKRARYSAADTLTRRWGLRFRDRANALCRRDRCLLDASSRTRNPDCRTVAGDTRCHRPRASH